MAYISTSQPLEILADFDGKYLLIYGHDTFPYFPHKDKTTQLVSRFWLK